MLRKTLMALVAVTALTVSATASAATVSSGVILRYDPSPGGPSQTFDYYQVQYDCSTNTFTGVGTFQEQDWFSPFRQVQTQITADNTITGTLTPSALSLSFSGPQTGSASVTLNEFTPGEYAAPSFGLGSNVHVWFSPSCRRFPAVTSADQCKGDGWKAVSSADDITFKNQGDCVSYVTTKGKNGPAGS